MRHSAKEVASAYPGFSSLAGQSQTGGWLGDSSPRARCGWCCFEAPSQREATGFQARPQGGCGLLRRSWRVRLRWRRGRPSLRSRPRVRRQGLAIQPGRRCCPPAAWRPAHHTVPHRPTRDNTCSPDGERVRPASTRPCTAHRAPLEEVRGRRTPTPVIDACSKALSGRYPPHVLPREDAVDLRRCWSKSRSRSQASPVRRPLPERLSALVASAALRSERADSVSAGQTLSGGRDRV